MIKLSDKIRRNEGFTLIELMIVVAIIGILAAIAIPNFLKFQLRAKAGEGKLNLAAIRSAQESYFAEAGTYGAWDAHPEDPNSQKQEWDPGDCPEDPDLDSRGDCVIGWAPEGNVYYQYAVAADATGSGPPYNQFFASAQSDIDGDTVMNTWGISRPDASGGEATAAHAECGDGVLNSSGDPVVNQVGPCDSVRNGLEIF